MKQLIRNLRFSRPLLAGIALVGAACGTAHASNEGFATLRATVGGNGTVVSSNGLTNAIKISAGVKSLAFTRDISTCTITVSGMGGVPFLAIASPSSPTTVTVRTFGLNGVLENRSFAMIIQCGP